MKIIYKINILTFLSLLLGGCADGIEVESAALQIPDVEETPPNDLFDEEESDNPTNIDLSNDDTINITDFLEDSPNNQNDTSIDTSATEDAGNNCATECAENRRAPCSCDIRNPCGWQGDGVCDWSCREISATPFDDLEDCDKDYDFIPDPLEYDLAEQFSPILIFSTTEIFEGRETFWSVDPTNTGVSIFYALGYFVDGGDPDLANAYNHLGDSEFIVIDIEEINGYYYPERIFLSAHYKASNDSSSWHAANTFFLQNNTHPQVWVAEWKHANYASTEACDSGGFFNSDFCNYGWTEQTTILEDRNLGSPLSPIIDEVSFSCSKGLCIEYFGEDERFCGWQVGFLQSRTDCSPEANSYSNQLFDWYLGF